MSTTQEAFHGSDIELIAKQYNIDINSIIPYASNVNPLGLSPLARQALINNVDIINSYPDRNYEALRKSISKYCGASPSQIILGNGTSDLIRVALDTIAPKKTLILGPTYSEYKRAASLAGSKVGIFMLRDKYYFELDVEKFTKALDETIDLVIICNPNNPTSTLLKHHQMETILKRCQELNIYVLIDETYIEFVDNVSSASCVLLTRKYENLIVLRSVSKFFAAPGLRLGYAITNNAKFLSETSNGKVPWNINSYASIAGVMFEDERYIKQTQSLIHTERNLIYSALSSRKTIQVFKPEANYILIKLLKIGQTSKEVFEHCIQKGFMIRDCSDYFSSGDQYIRFCFMKPEQNDEIVNTLLEIV